MNELEFYQLVSILVGVSDWADLLDAQRLLVVPVLRIRHVGPTGELRDTSPCILRAAIGIVIESAIILLVWSLSDACKLRQLLLPGVASVLLLLSRDDCTE